MRTCRLPVLDESVLDRIAIASPCPADWDAMRGDERVRHCPSCRKNVYNLSEMTRGEAVRLLATHEGAPCLRLFRRTDGTLVTADCRERLRRARVRGLGPFVVALVLVAITQIATRVAALGWLAGWTSGRPAPSLPLLPTMGAPPPSMAPLRARTGQLAAPPHLEHQLGGPKARPEPRKVVAPPAPARHTMGKPSVRPFSPPSGEVMLGTFGDIE